MSHHPKTEIGRLMALYRAHEHEPDDYGENEDGDPILSEKSEIAAQMRDLLGTGPFARSTISQWQARCYGKNVGRHGRSRKKNIPTRDGQIATDSHGRFMYVLFEGRKVVAGFATVAIEGVPDDKAYLP